MQDYRERQDGHHGEAGCEDQESIEEARPALRGLRGAGAVLRRGRSVGELFSNPSPRPEQRRSELSLNTSGGDELPPDLRQSWEATLDTDLSSVRVHTGTNAAADCEQMNAEAFTRGQDIYMGGSYNTELLAHEVAHTVQNSHGETSALDGLGGDAGTRESLEASADRVASGLVSTPHVAQENRPMQSQDQRPEAPVQKKEKEMAPASEPRAIQRKAAPIQRRGRAVAGGATNVRRVDGSGADRVVAAIQAAAERRRGHGGFGDTPANIQTNGIAQRIVRFLQSRDSVANGNFNSGWSDDNGESRTFDAWDYKMRVSFWVGYENERHIRDIGQVQSTQGTQSTTGAGESLTTTDGSSVSGTAGVEGGAGGHEGAPSGKANAGVELGSSHETEVGSNSSEGNQGSEGFTSSDGADRFEADMVVNFTVEFQPKGATLGFLSNIHVDAQSFTGAETAGSLFFDRARM